MMLTLKLMGLTCLLATGGTAAFTLVREWNHRLHVLEAWLTLLRHIRAQIDCFLLPLDKSLANADPKLVAAAGGGQAEYTLHALLLRARPYLSDECDRLLTALLRELGTTYKEEQLRRFDYYFAMLQIERDKLASVVPQRKKLCITLCLAAAVGTALILW